MDTVTTTTTTRLDDGLVYGITGWERQEEEKEGGEKEMFWSPSTIQVTTPLKVVSLNWWGGISRKEFTKKGGKCFNNLTNITNNTEHSPRYFY